MIVSRSRTIQSPPFTVGGAVLKDSDDLDIFGVLITSFI